MKPSADIAGLTKPKLWEYALRFAFGGIVAVVAHQAAKAGGDFVGGLALAFPAILPAALTLVKQHDGRQRAADDARGARFGTIGLIAFATVILLLSREGPWVALPLALLAWVVTSVALWFLFYGRR